MKSSILTLIILLLSQAGGGLHAQSAKKIVKEAQLKYAEGKFQESVDLCTKALETEPSNGSAFHYRALSWKELKNYPNAIRDFQSALNSSPKSERLVAELASTFVLAGEKQDAIKAFDRLIELDNKSAFAYAGKSAVQLDMGDFDGAYQTAAKGMESNKSDERCAYLKAQASDSMGNYALAEVGYSKALDLAKSSKEYRNNPVLLKKFYTGLAKTKIRLSKDDEALNLLNDAIQVAPDDYQMYNLRAGLNIQKLNFQDALGDLNKSIALQGKNPDAFYLRGSVNQKMGQFSSAISDYNQAVLLQPNYVQAIAGRASCQLSTGKYNEAVRDYQKALELNPQSSELKKQLAEARTKQYEANVESVKPVLTLLKPQGSNQELVIRTDAGEIEIEAQVNDASGIKSIVADGQSIPVNEEALNPTVRFAFQTKGKEMLEIRVTDIYLNTSVYQWKLVRTEIDPPTVRIVRPIQSLEGNTLYIENKPSLMIEGKVRDASLIQSIFVNESTASFPLDQKDPSFQALVSIGTRDSLVVQVSDIYGNQSRTKYKIVREDTSGANPMGITWVVFIENTNYKNLQKLEGPSRDVSEMKAALANYKIDNVLHKKDMSKAQLDRFFSIDLRDQVQKNRVKSLIIWYAGHGKFLNETGYWIPVDGDTYEEFTYYSVNSLRASMQAYTMLKHVLVVSDACESGPAFYMAMRDDEIKNRQCSDWEVTKFKSAQVLTSSNKELSSDNSLFTQAFANTLNNNPNDCVSIEYVATKVSGIVKQNQKQTPKFGKIKGLDDENGTFFFVKKDF